MQRIFPLVIPLVVLLALPAAADMFGPDYPPCGDQANTTAIVDCVKAKTRVWDERLNKAYKVLPQRIDAGQLGPLKDALANCGFYGSQDGTIRLQTASTFRCNVSWLSFNRTIRCARAAAAASKVFFGNASHHT